MLCVVMHWACKQCESLLSGLERFHFSVCPSVHQSVHPSPTLSSPARLWTTPMWPDAEHRREQGMAGTGRLGDLVPVPATVAR